MLEKVSGLPKVCASENSLRLLTSTDEFAAIADDWKRLEKLQSDPVFFQSHAWSAHIADVCAKDGPNGYKPLVAILECSGAIRAIWPLSLQRSFGLVEVNNIDAPFGQFAGLLTESEVDAMELVGGALATLQTNRSAHMARFERVLIGSHLHRALKAAGARTQTGVQAPFIDLKAVGSYENLKATRKKKSMKNLRNAVNRLNRRGDLRQSTIRDPNRLDELVARTLANRERWLAETGATSPAFRVAGHDKVLIGCSGPLRAQRIGFEMTLDDQSIAQQWGYIFNDTYYAYMSGVGEDATQFSPGRVHLAKTIQSVIEEGIGRIEMLTPASPYKLTWADEVHELVDMTVDLSALGRTKRLMWDHGIRPMAKSAFYRLPASVRKRVVD